MLIGKEFLCGVWTGNANWLHWMAF